MALLQRNVTKLGALLTKYTVRPLSTSDKGVKKSVFISQSNDVYTNLALESWIYKNFDFTNHHVLLVTKNDPCVVIGSNQNPWVETNVTGFRMGEENVTTLARRPNTGNAVYNDHGNLNLTFFTPSEHHNAKYDLEIMSRALFRKYSMKFNLASNENLSVYGKNVDANTTTSVTPKKLNFMNVREVTPKAQLNEILSAIGWEYLRTHAYVMRDGGKELANTQKGFQMINPTEKWFPGLTEIRENFETWDWCYGKTPKFSINRTFPVPEHLLTNYEGGCPDLCITLKVEHGRINDVTLFVPPGLTSSGFSGEAKVITSLKGHKFSEDAMNSLEWYLGVGENSYADDKDKFVTECFRQVMTSV